MPLYYIFMRHDSVLECGAMMISQVILDIFHNVFLMKYSNFTYCEVLICCVDRYQRRPPLANILVLAAS